MINDIIRLDLISKELFRLRDKEGYINLDNIEITENSRKKWVMKIELEIVIDLKVR